MKRTISLFAGILAVALVPALAQQPAAAPATAAADNGKVHGHITNPTGAPQNGGTVEFRQVIHAASGPGLKATEAGQGTFTVDANGDYSGQVPAGNYTVIYRSPEMPQDKQADQLENVTVVAGKDNASDLDMSRAEYIEKLPEDQKKQLQELRSKNAEAMKANEVIKNLNADLKVVGQDLKDADTAHAAAAQQLGASAAKADVDAKTTEIKTAKYTDVETLMTKDAQMRPTEPVLWAYLAQAQAGMKKYDDAETSYKKAIGGAGMGAGGIGVDVRRELDSLVTQMHSSGIRYDDAVREFKRQYLREVLVANRGNQCKAADELGIHRNTLSRTMAELGLELSEVRTGLKRPVRSERPVISVYRQSYR